MAKPRERDASIDTAATANEARPRRPGVWLLKRLVAPGAAYWWIWAALLAAAAWLRTDLLDMPPFDFPADRQRTNFNLTLDLAAGRSLFSQRYLWIELPILPWLAARTHAMVRWAGIELWTWTRAIAAAMGIATVALAWAIGWLAAAGSTPERRRRIGLLTMAGVALLPAHARFSRLILTEPATLFFQAAAVAAYFGAWQLEGRRRTAGLAAALVAFMMACWAKLPALTWAPALGLDLVARGRVRRRTMLAVAAAGAVAIALVFWAYGLNPLHMWRSFAATFPVYGTQGQLWAGNPQWDRVYWTRLAAMLTLPGMILAFIGLVCAPWVFRLTALVFGVLFYRLVTLNYYNFCHIILPGMALAAWGADRLIDLAGAGARSAASARAQRAFAVALLIAAVAALYPLGPTESHDPLPRPEITQAERVIRALVEPGIAVINDDMEGSLTHVLRQNFMTTSEALDLRTGYYYSIRRFGETPLRLATGAWVRWASLPGEPAGLLFTAQPRTDLPEAVRAEYVRLLLPPAAAASETADAPRLELAAVELPGRSFNRSNRLLQTTTGSTLTLRLEWNNPGGATLACLRWISAEWHTGLPVPLREGGFAHYFLGPTAAMSAGVVCLPPGERSAACYTFEIPPSMPPGFYAMEYLPLRSGDLRWPAGNAVRLPFLIDVRPSPTAPLPDRRDYVQLYPMDYLSAPTAWERARSWRAMRLIGYSLVDPERHLFACPNSPPGVYEVSVRGEAIPAAAPDRPDDAWPTVDIMIPGDGPPEAVGRIEIRSRQAAEHRTVVLVPRPFSSLLLQANLPPPGPEPPLWALYFQPARLGRAQVTLREVRLQLRRPLFPGDTAGGQP